MLQTRFSWTILLMLTALLGSAWIVISREPEQRPAFTSLPEAPIVGHPAPTFTLATPTGQRVSLIHDETAVSQPIVLNFWATWCGPCRIEMPHFQRASQNFNGRVTFLGINQGESINDIIPFQEEFNLTYPLLVDQSNEINNLYNVRSLPTTIFIDKNGIVQEVIIGTINQAVLEDRINQLLES